MLRKSILVLGSAIAVGLVALAGIAVAEIASDDAGTSAMDALVVRSTTTMIDDHGESAPTESTTTSTTTMGDDEYDDDSAPMGSTTTTTMVDDHGEPAPAASTTTSTMVDDEYDDDEYDDDEYDDRSIADGFETIDVSPAGSFAVEVRNGMLYLTSMDIDSNWMLAKRDEQSEQFELLFYWGESELKIKVEIDSGHLKKMIEFDMKHD